MISVLYRGPLSSCNYGCEYCPFAKHVESDVEHYADAQALERFVGWVEARREQRIAVFFTPWGEALVRKRYQRALVRLTQMPNLEKAAIQTNASCRFDWVEECDKSRLALWITFHPSQTTRVRFLERCAELQARGVRFSVGVVGLHENRDEIAALRAALPPEIYLWINAFKRRDDYYSAGDVEFLESIDPLFSINNQRHASFGRACRTGDSVFSVDGEGAMRRCHFVPQIIGNIYAPDWQSALQKRSCPNFSCGCHIGYVHLDELQMDEIFDDGILERIPARRAELLKRAKPTAIFQLEGTAFATRNGSESTPE